MQESPIHGYTELECYQKALKLRQVVGRKGRITAKAAAPKVGVSEGQIVKLARAYFKHSMMIMPYGQTSRIFMRPLKGEAS